MIAPNTRTQIRKRLVKSHQCTVVQQQRVIQATFNAVLWGIIKGGAQSADPEVEGDAVLKLPRADLEQIPANFGLVLTHNDEDDTISIRAVVMKPKGNIIVPGDE